MLAVEDIGDVETTEAGRKKVKFNHSKAAEACLSKFPIAFCIQIWPIPSEGLRFWDGQSYAHVESVLRCVLDEVAGNAINRAKANLMFDLMRHKLLVLPRVDLPERNGRFLVIHRREPLGAGA
jgi:hypothetical protein